MPIPLSIILFDRGANGAPTTTNPVNLAGRVESYEDTVSDRYGFETARVAWTPPLAEVEEWARYDHLMRPMVAYSPDARQIWRGVLAEIEISIGTKKIAFSLKDMANRLTVRYSEPGGAQGDSSTYSSAASQALFGIKDRVINASVALSAAASNQAQTILNAIAFPRSKQPSAAGTTRGDLSITLTFWGKYALLDWLLTASTSTTSTATSTQIASLLASYAAINAFFSSSAANITATGVADTEYIEPDTTYREKIERLLARGTSSQQPLAWGFYDDDAFVVTPRASATPTVITYYESEASGQIRDQWQNVLDVWDVRPNAMSQIVDLIDAPTPGSVETPFRKYVARVTRSVRGEDVTVTLEPDDTESLEDLLTSPAGAGPAGTSERQAAFERKITAPARSVFAGMDNATRYDRSQGVWKPAAGGTGKVNTGTLDVPSNGTVDLGGGSISNTGGGAVDVGTGAGIGSSGSLSETIDDRVAALLTAGSNITLTYNDGANTLTIAAASSGGTVGGTGTAGWLTQWATGGANIENSTLIKSGAGVLTISAGSTATFTIDSSTRLDGSGATTGQVLTYNGTAFAPTTLAASDLSAAPDDATYIVKTAASGLSNEFALSTLSTGLLKVTTTTGALTTATASDLPNHASRHGNGGADELALDGGQITTGTVPAARLGSGTSITSKYLRGDNTWQTLSTVSGSGATGQLAYWSSSSALTSDSGMTFDGELHAPGRIRAEGSTAGIGLDDRDGSGQWLLYVDGNGFYVSSTITGGTNLLGVSSSAVTPASGSSVDLGSGGNKFATMYGTTLNLGGNQVVSSRRTGWSLPSGTVSRSTFVTGTATVTEVAQRLAALLNDLSTHGLIGS